MHFKSLIFRLLYGNFEFPIRTIFRGKNIEILRKKKLKKSIQTSKNKMKMCTEKPLQQIIALVFSLKRDIKQRKLPRKF